MSSKKITTPTCLYRYRANQMLSLNDAIEACNDGLANAIAILYSAQSCHLATLALDTTLRNAQGEIIELGQIFEARIFNQQCELRWLNRMDGKGDTALITESELSIEGFAKTEKDCESLEQQYLLWGEQAKNQPSQAGWQRLAEARIGKLDIPFSQTLTKNQKVCLKSYEYLAVANQYGNVAVLDERLVCLEGI